jgi:light-regulated signal transduction histidine kinase (bacteriophytochrome)
LSTPAFGQADLSNCEREQIHFAGSIQPHGALLLLREPDLTVVQASANAGLLLGLATSPLGRPLASLADDLARQLGEYLREPPHSVAASMRCRADDTGAEFTALVHRPADGGLIVELEPAGPTMDPSALLTEAFDRVVACHTLGSLCDEAAKIFKTVAGYDRVMVYRFDDDGHGEVFSEIREPNLEAFLGNRYPASDIPQIARRLYIHNRVRILVDVGYEPVPLTPRLSPLTGQDLDMSLCSLRSMSPMHIQYLKNMGVGATLVVSLVVGDKLWGLVACHHYSPRFVPFDVRSVCELLGEAIATRIAALESFLQSQAELSVRRLEQRMIDSISSEGDWRGALFDNATTLLQPVGASGAALLIDGQVQSTGDVPGTRELRELGRWLDARPPQSVTATASLGLDGPQFEPLARVASGLLAAPISASPGEYLLWFRPERVRTITWGGNPFKPVVIGDDPRDLSPRRSFSQWRQLMEGASEPWTAADQAAARLIAATVADVVLQFRSVQMLILQDQLGQVRRQVLGSEPPLVIADAEGRIILRNEAFERLMPASHIHLQWLHDLAAMFSDPAEVRGRLADLVGRGKTWRGEVHMNVDLASARTLLIRADPVYASADRVRGYVLLLNDNGEQKAAALARRRFQEGLVEQRRLTPGPIKTVTDLAYHNLLSSVVENAQLAALEITDRADVARMPEMLESVRASVARTAELLKQLIVRDRRRGGANSA